MHLGVQHNPDGSRRAEQDERDIQRSELGIVPSQPEVSGGYTCHHGACDNPYEIQLEALVRDTLRVAAQTVIRSLHLHQKHDFMESSQGQLTER